LKFWDPLHISGTVGARNIKVGKQTITRGTDERNAKLGHRESLRCHVTYF